jgi:hypothetical protein
LRRLRCGLTLRGMTQSPEPKRRRLTAEERQQARERGWKLGQDLWASKDGRINWRAPNVWIFLTLVIAAVIASTERRSIYFGFVPEDRMLAVISYGFAVLTRGIAGSFQHVIEDFKPRTQLEAKRANEQIKATATLINAAAAGTLTALVIAQVAKASEPNYLELVFSLGLALWIHTASRTVLGLLKDENLPTVITHDQASA